MCGRAGLDHRACQLPAMQAMQATSTYVIDVLLGLQVTPYQLPVQGSPTSQPWLLAQLCPLVALYRSTKAARWAGRTPGTRVPDGLGEGDGEGLTETEGEGAGEYDAGSSHTGHQGCRV